jgi:hypothetical protein
MTLATLRILIISVILSGAKNPLPAGANTGVARRF